MPPAAKIWAAKAEPKLATTNTKGLTAGKVSIPAVVKDGPGKGRQVDCEILPSQLDDTLAQIVRAIEVRNAEALWREEKKAATKKNVAVIFQAPEPEKAKPVKKTNGTGKSGIDTLKELLTLPPVDETASPEPKKDTQPRRPWAPHYNCKCGCEMLTNRSNGYVWGHANKAKVKVR